MSPHETPGTAGNDPQREPAQGNVQAVPERREVTVRRAPKYVPFLILGGLLGVAVAAIIAYALPGDAELRPLARSSASSWSSARPAASSWVPSTALVLDRRSVRRAEHAVVESAPDADDDGGRGGNLALKGVRS